MTDIVRIAARPGAETAEATAVQRYLREFGAGWRPLLAAFVGMGSGYTINNYTNNLFIPALMQEFGWHRADVALIGAAATLSVVFQPLAGRMTDRFGVQPVALLGTIIAAAIFLLLSLMTGTFWVFLVLVMLQIALVASTTGAVVFSRPIAVSFFRARGLALSIAVCAPSVAGALLVPALTTFITDHGWRAGYRLLALATLVCGMLAVWLVPRTARSLPYQPDPGQDVSPAGEVEPGEWRALLGSRAIWIISSGMILCSLSISLQTTQLKVVFLDIGLSGPTASGLIAIYALGVIGGRLCSGLALDLLPTRFVACVALALPAIGLCIVATGSNDYALLVIAMLTLGLSLGAEGDIAGYLVMTYVPARLYSTGLGLVIGAIAFASGIGGLLLAAMLQHLGSFQAFLYICAACAALGGCMFLSLQSHRSGR